MRSTVLALKRARRMRKALSLPEAMLWVRLRGRAAGRLAFRRQHPMGAYILDFYCVAARLAVEVDGGVHSDPAQFVHDQRRNAWLREQRVRVLRISAGDVLADPDGTAEAAFGAAARLIAARAT